MNSFKTLLDILNGTIETLNKNGYHIRDNLNPEHYVSKIYYDSDKDELYFDTEEEVIQRWSVESDT